MSKLRPLLLLLPCLKTNMSSKKAKMSSLPPNMAQFGYGFNSAGQMRKVGHDGQLTDQEFQFEDQAHYEALGEVITEEVYSLMETQGKLNRVPIGPSKPKSFIFCSSDCLTSGKLLVLIHGSGVVRAGQWARRLIINEDLNKGTMLPFIAHARQAGWGMVVMNTNMNTDTDTGRDIPGSETPEEHANTVWQNVVAKSEAKNIVIIAHSYGGVVTMNLARTFKTDFLERVSGVFLTDSVHYKMAGDKEVDRKLERMGKNYVGSHLELATPVKDMFGGEDGIPRFSAGHEKHEWTSWAAMEEIFKDMEKAGNDTSEDTVAVDASYQMAGNIVGEESASKAKNEEL